MKHHTNIDRDWKEDFHLENGTYLNHCAKCENFFYGHKRRTRCKLCMKSIKKKI